VVTHLRSVGCAVDVAGDALTVVPPSWRLDLTDPADLDEEVIRLHGYDAVPSTLPRLPAGRGLTAAQRARRLVPRLLASRGFVEVLAYPFVGEPELDALGLPADDERRRSVRLANPLSDEQPLLRTTLLPGLLAVLARNLGRGAEDPLLFEIGAVYRWPSVGHAPARGGDVPRPSVSARPTTDELAALDASLPDERRRLALVLAGDAERHGWWGAGRAASWADAVDAVLEVAAALGVQATVRAGRVMPWHPGRCAELVVDGVVVGHAGELHPRVCESLGLPPRTCAAEIDLDAVLPDGSRVVAAPTVSTFPVAKEDLAVVVADDVPVASVQQALADGAGDLLESIRLFDVYAGPQVGEGRRSLAFALRFRAPDRTLSADETAAARTAALEHAAEQVGAQLRT
jgi:phenylalanyl-tRNA synthetase beta chain